ELAPPAFADYLRQYWLCEQFFPMWSAVFRTDRDIYEESDTNMLIEAWHHVLKGKFLQGKRNRRLDFLLHVLIDDVLPHFRLREHRQLAKFEGFDLEMRRRRDIHAKCKSEFSADDIVVSTFAFIPH
ncbi:hypothetical protein C8J56DRAFT_752125, partial [Mycena floridula]